MRDDDLGRVSLSRSQRKLVGWGILAAVALIIVVIFLLTHQLSQQTNTVSTAVPATSPTAAPTGAPAAPAAPSAQSGSSTDSTAQVVDLAKLTQPQRRAFVQTLIRQGVFTGVQATESPPKVGVTPLFQALSLDLKQQFIAAVEAYVHDGAATTEALQIIDASTSKTIGTYTVADGLKLQQ